MNRKDGVGKPPETILVNKAAPDELKNKIKLQQQKLEAKKSQILQ